MMSQQENPMRRLATAHAEANIWSDSGRALSLLFGREYFHGVRPRNCWIQTDWQPNYLSSSQKYVRGIDSYDCYDCYQKAFNGIDRGEPKLLRQYGGASQNISSFEQIVRLTVSLCLSCASCPQTLYASSKEMRANKAIC